MTTLDDNFAVSARVLKDTVRKAIEHAVANFKADTGVTPAAIEVRMLDVTGTGGPRDYVVGDVRIKFDL